MKNRSDMPHCNVSCRWRATARIPMAMPASTMIAVAIPVLALYVFWGRHAKSDTARQVTWIAASSQALAVVVVILAFILNWLALILAGIFAAIALLFLLGDRG